MNEKIYQVAKIFFLFFFFPTIPSRGDKIIKIAKGSLKDLIFQIQPAGYSASPYSLHHFPLN